MQEQELHLHDIKPLVEIDDYSLVYFSILVFGCGWLCFAGVVYAVVELGLQIKK